MATQTPSFSQTMSDPTFKAYTKEGVVSKLGGASSAANLATIAEVGKMGLDVHKGYVTSNLEKLQQGEIEDYLSKSPTKIAEVEQEAASLENVMSQFALVPLDENPDMEAFDAKYSGVQAEHAKRLDYLKKASEQGVMTPEMFAERVIKNTREAVAKNPGLARELMASSQTVLELSGIQGRIQQDTNLAAQQAKALTKRYSDVEAEISKRNILRKDVIDPSGEINLGKADAAIDKHRAMEAVWNMNKELNTQAKILDEAEVRQLVDSGAVTDLFNFGINRLEQSLTTLFNDNTINISKKIELAERMVVDAEQELSTKSLIGKHMNVPEVKEGFTTFNRQATSILNAVKNAKDGTTAANAIKNELSIVADTEKLGLHKKLNVAEANAASQIMRDLGPAVFNTDQGKVLVTSMVDVASNLLRGMSVSKEDFQKDPNLKDNASKIGATLRAAANGVAEKKVESPSLMNKIFGATITSIFDSKVTENPMDAFTRMEEVNSILKDPKLAEAWKGLDEDTRSKVSSMVDNYNDQLAVSFANYIKDHPTENIKLSMLPDGTLAATGGSTTFNRDLLGRVNSGLKAYANLQGTTTDKVRDEFFVNYYGDAFADQATFLETRGAKNNITNVVDSTTKRTKEFASLEEGVQYSQQKVLDIYKTNKRSVASIVNVLRPEDSRVNSFYMPQADYVKQVAKTMGVGEREILDLSKPYTMSSFLSAVAQVEGKSISVGRISDALTKPPLPASSQAYYNATRQAGEQRQQIYNGIAQFFRPVSTLIDKGYATIGGLVVDLATMPAQIAWDMDYYKKTGELKHKYETQGLTPNISKLVTQVIAPIESGSRQIDPKTNQLIESPAGAKGITQVMPKTGRNPGYGVAPLPENASEAEYIKFSENYFGAMLKLFKNDTSKALAAYNAGPGAVQDAVDLAGPAWLVALPPETKDYVLKARLREAKLLGER